MKWFSVHVIMTTRFKEGVQSTFPVMENVYLICAHTLSEAREKATERARQSEGDSRGSYKHEGRPATLVFEGIRKLIECEEPERAPADGDELTYSMYEVDDSEAVGKLVGGEAVTLRYDR